MITLKELYDCEDIIGAIENLLEAATEDEAERLNIFEFKEKAEELRNNARLMLANI